MKTNDEWQPWIDYNGYNDVAMCTDTMKNNLYFLDKSGFVKICIHHGHISTIPLWYFGVLENPRLGFVGNRLHILETRGKKHFIFDPVANSVDYAYFDGVDEAEMDRMDHAELIAVNGKHAQLILIGGDLNEIYSYSVKSNKWNVLGIKLPHKIYGFAHAVTLDQRYVLLFGGRKKEPHFVNNIYVIDLEHNQIMESAIRCPWRSCDLRAVITNHDELDYVHKMLIVLGFVRDCWKDDAFNFIQMPPVYIVRLMAIWYSRECIHLLENKTFHSIVNCDFVINNVRNINV